MNTRRLFIALPVPEDIKKKIVAYRDDLNLRLKYIPSDNYHLTLLFLGNTPEVKIAEISKQLSNLSKLHAPFDLTLESLTVKNSRFQNMIWVKFHPSLEFENLSIDISNTLGFEVKRKPLPHINLVRSKPKIHGPFPFFFKEKLSFHVNKFELWASALHPKGATYSNLKSFPLKRHHGKKER